MEAADAEGELGGGRGVVRVDGGDETAAAAIGEGYGVVQTVIAHDGAYGSECLDLVDAGRAAWIGAMQQDRRNECAARGVGLDRLEVVDVAGNDLRFGAEPLQIGQY